MALSILFGKDKRICRCRPGAGKYSEEILQDFMGLSGFLWVFQDLYGSFRIFQDFMGLLGSLWVFQDLYESFWILHFPATEANHLQT
jgi:hypothetical protein